MDENAWDSVTELDNLSAFSGFALSFEQVFAWIASGLSGSHRLVVSYYLVVISWLGVAVCSLRLRVELCVFLSGF